MPIPFTETTLICPENDAESATIIRIAHRLGLDVRVSKQRTWFCPLDKEPRRTFRRLRPIVVIVEMPGPTREAELQETHDLRIIDHHGYPSLGFSRERSESSLEQFAALVGYVLTRDERAVAVNDQRYIYGLQDAGFTPEEIARVRRFDLQLQGYSAEEFAANERDAASGVTTPNGTTCYLSSIPKYSHLVDLHVLRCGGERSNVLIRGQTRDQRGQFLFFSGDIRLLRQLKTLGGYSKESTRSYGLWGGYERGAEAVDLRAAIEIATGASTWPRGPAKPSDMPSLGLGSDDAGLRAPSRDGASRS